MDAQDTQVNKDPSLVGLLIRLGIKLRRLDLHLQAVEKTDSWRTRIQDDKFT